MRPRRWLPRRSWRLEHNQSHSLFHFYRHFLAIPARPYLSQSPHQQHSLIVRLLAETQRQPANITEHLLQRKILPLAQPRLYRLDAQFVAGRICRLHDSIGKQQQNVTGPTFDLTGRKSLLGKYAQRKVSGSVLANLSRVPLKNAAMPDALPVTTSNGLRAPAESLPLRTCCWFSAGTGFDGLLPTTPPHRIPPESCSAHWL